MRQYRDATQEITGELDHHGDGKHQKEISQPILYVEPVAGLSDLESEKRAVDNTEFAPHSLGQDDPTEWHSE